MNGRLVACMYAGSEWVDPYDPTVVAESELMSAANSIEAAARKLSQLQPRELMSKVSIASHRSATKLNVSHIGLCSYRSY